MSNAQKNILNQSLFIKSQNGPGASDYPLAKRRIVIGSATSVDLRLSDAQVSSIHAIIEVNEAAGTTTIYDLASETGVRVNGSPSVQTLLKAGDQIQIGPYLIELRKSIPGDPGTQGTVKEDLRPLILEDEGQVHEIFDFSGQQTPTLQVVMLYIDSILDVLHFKNKKRVVIGPRDQDDFGVPPTMASMSAAGRGRGRFELVSWHGGQCFLNLNEAMGGVVNQGGQLKPVKQVLKEVSLDSKGVVLGEKDFAKVTLGDISFFVNFTPAPPRLKFQRLWQADPLFARIWFLSLALTLMIVSILTRVTVTPVLEIEQLPERIATIIYKPELLPVERTPVAPPEKVEAPKPTPPAPAPAPTPAPKAAPTPMPIPKMETPVPKPAQPTTSSDETIAIIKADSISTDEGKKS